MRDLIIARGPQGAGKSTTLRALGLEHHIVSADLMRRTLNGPYLDPSGNFVIPQQRSKEAWDLVYKILEDRMEAGETVALDATLPYRGEVERFVRMADEHRYRTHILDFYTIPVDLAKSRNAAREPFLRVPEFAIDRVYGAQESVADLAPVITWDPQDAHVEGLLARLRVPMRDLSNYRRVAIIGDLQGCKRVLGEPGSPLAGELLDPNTFYIFVGDYLDRGLENGELLHWMLANRLHEMPNVLLLRGNHELHLERWVDGKEPVSYEFRHRTLPQIVEAGITPAMAAPLVRSFLDVVTFRYNEHEVLVTHAGLPSWPERLDLVPTEQYSNGPGKYEEPVDEMFARWAAEHEAQTGRRVIQIHGHRNSRLLPVQASPYSYNLEAGVEFGGNLRALTIDATGITPVEVRNPIFISALQRQIMEQRDGRKSFGRDLPVPPWIARGERNTKIAPETLRELRKHDMIRERVAKALPHISAFNFSKQAFNEGIWDETTVSFRGVYIDTNTGEIVARAYNKFFNIGEMPETKPEVLRDKLVFPVKAERKENGFLGIVGYDRATGQLIVSSKSMIESDFAGWFDEILTEQIGEAGRERLLRLCRDMDASVIFEVIDPVRDPHIITYDKAQCIMLDVVHRSERFETLPYADLKKVAEHIGTPVKEQTTVLENWEQMEKFLQRVTTDRDFKIKGQPVEGFVLKDANGYMVKAKSKYYADWKRMRSAKDYVLKWRTLDENARKPLRRYNDPVLDGFLDFCLRQPDTALQKPIIELREAYLADPQQILEGENKTVHKGVETARGDLLLGFKRGAIAVGKQIEAGSAKQESIDRLVAQALEDLEKREILESAPAFAPYLQIANVKTR